LLTLRLQESRLAAPKDFFDDHHADGAWNMQAAFLHAV